MTTAEIISSIISGLAFAISAFTAYLTLMSRFRGFVFPKRRAILTQVDGTLCLILECEFVNDGAKPGVIEDILIKMNHTESGSQVIFIPYLVRDQFNVFQNYQTTDFTTFSSISLGAKQRREAFIVFRPNQANFEPPTGNVVLKTSICTSITGKKWTESVVRISLDLKDEISREWISPKGTPQQVSAVEIGQSRREYLRKSQD